MSRHAPRRALRAPLLTCLAAAPLLACDGLDDPPRQPWTASYAALAPAVAPDRLDPPPADCGEVLRWTYAYDTDGRRVEAARFSDRAIADRVETRTHDDAGRILHARAEWTGGFVGVTLERDADGRVVRRVVDASESSMRSTAEIVERGPAREVIHFTGAVLLLDPFDPMTERRWDEAARAALHDPLIDGQAMIDALVRHLDAGAPLAPLYDPFEVVETRAFDAEGRPTLTEWDRDGDGIADQTRRWHYAPSLADGSQVRIEDDWEADGIADHWTHHVLDAAGRVILEELADGALEVDRQRLLTRDADGEVVEEALWLRPDDGGPLANVRTTTYTRIGDRAITEVDEDSDGTIDHRTTLWLRPDGQRVLKHEDAKADGEVDWQRRHVFDTLGREVYSERDRDVDGAVDLRWDYGYGEDGRLLHAVSTAPGSARCGGLRLE